MMRTLLLSYLEQGKSLTQAQIITLFNTLYLSSNIHCICNASYEIATYWEGNYLRPAHHARYELKSFPTN